MSTVIEYKSAITDHADRNNCIIDWEGVTVIDRTEQKRNLDQTGHMDPKDNSSHESRQGGYRLSHIWDGLLTKTTGE